MIDVYEIKKECEKRQSVEFDRKNCCGCPYYAKIHSIDECMATEAFHYGTPNEWELEKLEKNYNIKDYLFDEICNYTERLQKMNKKEDEVFYSYIEGKKDTLEDTLNFLLSRSEEGVSK